MAIRSEPKPLSANACGRLQGPATACVKPDLQHSAIICQARQQYGRYVRRIVGSYVPIVYLSYHIMFLLAGNSRFPVVALDPIKAVQNPVLAPLLQLAGVHQAKDPRRVRTFGSPYHKPLQGPVLRQSPKVRLAVL